MADDIILFHPNERVFQTNVEDEMKKSFLDYSMSVIVARALPDIRDGLKPVHRRILYTQYENNLTHDKPYHKCASTVGAVLAAYHPHGDASVYDALVRLAQDFSMRYPLVDGHGNFGSVDGDPPAAYRYTEARLSRISDEMLRDIGKETVDYAPNYDDTKKEPIVLPSRFPNLLVNGSVGIAVGMATNIPPHNLREVAGAVRLLIENPDTDTETLLRTVKGPDFPTGGIIMGTSGIRAAYYTGRGKITLRGRAEIIEEKTHTRIVVTEIPYMVNKSRLMENIGELIRDKRVEGISALRDESDRNGMKIVAELRRDANPSVVLNKLYSFTQLQDTVSVNLLSLVGGVPKTLGLREILEHYIKFQEEVITRRTRFDMEKARKRAHILQGLLLAADNIDEVINILRASKTVAEGKERLIERFKNEDMAELLEHEIGISVGVSLGNGYGLSKEQAEAIVAMTLGSLTGLEREKTAGELKTLAEKIAGFSEVLSDRANVLKVVADELDDIVKKYGDERRTSIEPVSGEVDIEDLIPVEESVLTFTNMGYVKRQALNTYETQGRGGKGISGMKRRDEDFVEDLFIASSHDSILFVTNYGNMFRLKCYDIPEGSRQSRGTNIVGLLQLSEGEQVAAMLKTTDFSPGKFFICVTKNGLIKRSELSLYKSIRRGGLRAVGLHEGDEIAAAYITEGDSTVIVATKNGRAVHFHEEKIRPSGRTAHGVRAVRLMEGDRVVGAAKFYGDDQQVMLVTTKGYGRRTPLSAYPQKGRGGKGLINYKPREDRGEVCGIKAVSESDDVLLINTEGIIIRIRVCDLRPCYRTSLGVRLMRLIEDSRVVNFARTRRDEDAETESVDESTDESVEITDESEADATDDED
ncbi:MAG: DNA gyrase subunit A [Oscillospiraceae bacterium]|jgi:DNA gyrase subunit A|nr:DNA gyrase subunit A [Oscillospiraceae bacterium]